MAVLTDRPRRASAWPECCLGDALTMIPPVTGNGMSMAFESAEIAIEPLTAYSEGEISWNESRRAVAQRCDQAFARRLAWARWLHWLLLTRALRLSVGRLLLRSDWSWRILFAVTR
jgi:2-polyprenyl-6-methoxyphenol hydroxylase-like FAD-dependent oxidoreductase